MERRRFVKTCCISAASGAAMASIIQSCAPIHYALHSKSPQGFTIAKSEFYYLKKEQEIERNFVLVQPAKYKYPICLYNSENHYSAAFLKCTHRGCELNVGGGIYTCPCHGSEFSVDGAVLEGPAENKLKTFPVTEDNENIYIQIG